MRVCACVCKRAEAANKGISQVGTHQTLGESAHHQRISGFTLVDRRRCAPMGKPVCAEAADVGGGARHATRHCHTYSADSKRGQKGRKVERKGGKEIRVVPAAGAEAAVVVAGDGGERREPRWQRRVRSASVGRSRRRHIKSSGSGTSRERGAVEVDDERRQKQEARSRRRHACRQQEQAAAATGVRSTTALDSPA